MDGQILPIERMLRIGSCGATGCVILRDRRQRTKITDCSVVMSAASPT